MRKCPNRRAIATIVTSGIFLSAIAIMGSMLTAYSNTIFANEQNEINTVYSNGVNKLNEFLVIENVWFKNEHDDANKIINLTMSNVGNVGLNVTKITLSDSTQKFNADITNGGLVPNDYFSTEINYGWTNTDPIKITITTEKGSIYQTNVMGP